MKYLTNFSNASLTITLISVIGSIIILCLIAVIIVLVIRHKKANKTSSYVDEIQKHDLTDLQKKEKYLEEEINRYRKLRTNYKDKLSLDNLSNNERLQELEKIITQELEEYKEDQLLKIDQDINQYKNIKLRQVILDTMQPMHLKIINESSTVYLPILDEVKRFIVGKKGQNIKKLNEITNCNINIDRDAPYIEISSPNPVERNLALNIIKHLIKSEAFDMVAIDNVYKKEKKLLSTECERVGKEYLDKLQINVPNPAIYDYVGRLKYRWSFNQNVLEHCYEVAIICEQLAKEFGLDPQIAKQVGFFHDIGKSIDYENKYNHINTGIEIAKKCDLPQTVIDGILKHHRTNCVDDYVLLVRCADAWSAARAGARHYPKENDDVTIKIATAKIKNIKNVASFKIILEDNTFKIAFICKSTRKNDYLKTKYDITNAIKKDVRLSKHPIVFLDETI